MNPRAYDGQQPLEVPGFNQLIDGMIEVLDAAVRQEGWLLIDQATRGPEK